MPKNQNQRNKQKEKQKKKQLEKKLKLEPKKTLPINEKLDVTSTSVTTPSRPSPTVNNISETELNDLIEKINRNDEWYDEPEHCDDLKKAQVCIPKPSKEKFNEIFGGGSQNGKPNLLANMLNPDMGGKGANTNGLQGLMSVNKDELTPLQRLQKAKRALYRQCRAGITPEDRVRDHKGKVIRGAKVMTQDDWAFGKITPAQQQRIQQEMKKRRDVAKASAISNCFTPKEMMTETQLKTLEKI